MPLRSCLGCGTPTSGTRCPACTSAKKAIKNRSTRHVYDAAWVKLSRQARAEHPWCARCGATDDLTVDHVAPRSLEAGVQVLCRSCNSSKSNK